MIDAWTASINENCNAQYPKRLEKVCQGLKPNSRNKLNLNVHQLPTLVLIETPLPKPS